LKIQLFLILCALTVSLSIDAVSTALPKPNKVNQKAPKKINSAAFKLCQTAVRIASEGDYNTAVIYLKRALELEPKFTEALFNLGSIYRVQKKYQDSYVAFQQLLFINPKDHEARLEKILTLIAMRSLNDASAELTKVPQTEKRYSQIKAQLNKALAKQASVQVKEDPQTLMANRGGLYKASYKDDIQTREKYLFNFSTPTGITADDKDNIYVANFSADTIEKISPDGAKRQMFASGSLLSGPSDLIFDNLSHELLVSNYKSGTIIKIDRQGQMQVLVDQLQKPYSLFLQHDGKLYVSEQGKKAVSIINIH
jgi:tetratricopeptide (TPR) repeat protein